MSTPRTPKACGEPAGHDGWALATLSFVSLSDDRAVMVALVDAIRQARRAYTMPVEVIVLLHEVEDQLRSPEPLF